MEDKQMKPLHIGMVFGFVLAIGNIVGYVHYASDLTIEAMEKAARPLRVAEEYRLGYRIDFPERVQLSYPLRCDDQEIRHQLPDGRWRVSCVVADLRSMK